MIKVILVHGDHIEKSQERIKTFIDVARKRGWVIQRLNDSKNQSLPEQLTSVPLFQEERLYLLEKVTSVGKKDLVWLKNNHKRLSGNLIIYHQGYLPKRVLSYLPKPDKEEVFEIPRKIWKFLDSFYPGNYLKTINLLHEVLENENPEFVLALLGKHLRDLYIAKEDPSLLEYPTWRTKKLISQAKKFKKQKLGEIIESLAKADYESKTSSKNLVFTLDLVIVTQLE
jgi:DNA polymerase III delta subunit